MNWSRLSQPVTDRSAPVLRLLSASSERPARPKRNRIGGRLDAPTGGPNAHLLEPWQVRCGDEVRELLTSRYDSLEAMSRASRKQAAADGVDPSEWTFFMRVARDPQMQAKSSLWPPEGALYERSATSGRATCRRISH